MLRRRGAAPHEIDDILQDAAVRLLEAEPEYEDADDLWPWAATVTGRLWIDVVRKRREVDPIHHTPDLLVGHADDVAHEVEHRLALAATVAAIDELRPPDRAAIRRALAAARTTQASALDEQRRRVQLHRARHRLRLRLEGLIAALTAVYLRLRTALDDRTAPTVLVTSVTVLGMSLFVFPGGSGPSTKVGTTVARPAAAAAAGASPAATPASAAVATPPAAGPSSGARSDPPPPAAVAPLPATPGPAAEVGYAAPLGTGRVGTRPSQPGDPIACVYLGSSDPVCVDHVPVVLPAPSSPPSPLPTQP